MKHFFTISWAAIVGGLTGILSSLLFDVIANIISDELEPSDNPVIMEKLEKINSNVNFLKNVLENEVSKKKNNSTEK